LLDLHRFDFITFDCYGTLIDWESGILDALSSFRDEHRIRADDGAILARYAALESELESGTYMRYRDVLRGVMRGLATHYSVADGTYDVDAIADSLPRWRPFPDTVAALRRLHERVRLGVISNTDDDLFAQTATHLGIAFDHVTTAEQVKSYKPSHRNFVYALERIGVAPERVLHAAQSRFHDVAPAHALGLSTVWVNRRNGRVGEGATPVSGAIPGLEVPDLKTLAERMEASS
jgi:2-haloacid dehalogenase